MRIGYIVEEPSSDTSCVAEDVLSTEVYFEAMMVEKLKCDV